MMQPSLVAMDVRGTPHKRRPLVRENPVDDEVVNNSDCEDGSCRASNIHMRRGAGSTGGAGDHTVAVMVTTEGEKHAATPTMRSASVPSASSVNSGTPVSRNSIMTGAAMRSPVEAAESARWNALSLSLQAHAHMDASRYGVDGHQRQQAHKQQHLLEREGVTERAELSFELPPPPAMLLARQATDIDKRISPPMRCGSPTCSSDDNETVRILLLEGCDSSTPSRTLSGYASSNCASSSGSVRGGSSTGRSHRGASSYLKPYPFQLPHQFVPSISPLPPPVLPLPEACDACEASEAREGEEEALLGLAPMHVDSAPCFPSSHAAPGCACSGSAKAGGSSVADADGSPCTHSSGSSSPRFEPDIAPPSPFTAYCNGLPCSPSPSTSPLHPPFPRTCYGVLPSTVKVRELSRLREEMETQRAPSRSSSDYSSDGSIGIMGGAVGDSGGISHSWGWNSGNRKSVEAASEVHESSSVFEAHLHLIEQAVMLKAMQRGGQGGRGKTKKKHKGKKGSEGRRGSVKSAGRMKAVPWYKQASKIWVMRERGGDAQAQVQGSAGQRKSRGGGKSGRSKGSSVIRLLQTAGNQLSRLARWLGWAVLM